MRNAMARCTDYWDECDRDPIEDLPYEARRMLFGLAGRLAQAIWPSTSSDEVTGLLVAYVDDLHSRLMDDHVEEWLVACRTTVLAVAKQDCEEYMTLRPELRIHGVTLLCGKILVHEESFRERNGTETVTCEGVVLSAACACLDRRNNAALYYPLELIVRFCRYNSSGPEIRDTIIEIVKAMVTTALDEVLLSRLLILRIVALLFDCPVDARILLERWLVNCAKCSSKSTIEGHLGILNRRSHFIRSHSRCFHYLPRPRLIEAQRTQMAGDYEWLLDQM